MNNTTETQSHREKFKSFSVALCLCGLLILLLLMGCSSKETPSIGYTWVDIAGRGDGTPSRNLIYRVKMPNGWKFSSPPLSESLADTTLPLCEFHIEENEKVIRFTIHNFPTNRIEERIPPQAQIHRWKQQIEDLDTASVVTIPQAYNGFVGALFEGAGKIHGESILMLGWGLQIGHEHYRNLSWPAHPIYQQMRADITIKAVGPLDLMSEHRDEIIAFARSFELIHEIPTR